MVGALKDEGHLIFLSITEMDSCLSVLCWCFVGGGTPVLIPNTAVKPSRSDGSRKARVARRQHKVLKKQRRVPEGTCLCSLQTLRCTLLPCPGHHAVERSIFSVSYSFSW